MTAKRTLRHLDRAAQAGARSETAQTEAERRVFAGRQLLHTIAAIDALQVEAGTMTRAEVRARRKRERGEA